MDKFINHDDLTINIADVSCFKEYGKAIMIIFKDSWRKERYWYFRDEVEVKEKLAKINKLIGSENL
jgi:hypothetical protein